MLGIPEGVQDFVIENSNPLESNLDLLNASNCYLLVDFHKGCYLGQELVIRTHHTGVVRKRIVPIQIASNIADFGDKPILKSEPTLHDWSDKIRETKAITKIGSCVGNIGLGLARLDQCLKPIELGPNLFIKAFTNKSL